MAVFFFCERQISENPIILREKGGFKLIGEQIEERKLFSYEERREILKENYGICACCGKKLTTKTMTVEHIIPLSRGGTNDRKNLTVLCYDCNQLKGNLLYLPAGFYSALRTKPKFDQMQHYLIDWYANVKNEFDIERYPMIGPRFYVQGEIPIGKHKKPLPFIKQLTFEYRLINKDYFEEIEAVTGLDLRSVRRFMRTYYKCDPEQPVAFYSVRKLIDDKILAVIAVNYIKKEHCFAVHIPWRCIAKSYFKGLMTTFLLNLLYTLVRVAKERIDSVYISSPYDECRDIAISFYQEVKAARLECEENLYWKETMEKVNVYQAVLVDIDQIARLSYKHSLKNQEVVSE